MRHFWKYNLSLTNDVVSFKQVGSDLKVSVNLSTVYIWLYFYIIIIYIFWLSALINV